MDLKNIKKYYQDKFKSFGATAEGMDWKDEASQYLRFEIIAKYIDFKNNPSILDVGCGSSEFLNFCKKKNLECDYRGLDIMKEMVEASNQNYGENTAILGDLNTIDKALKFDYVIASGTFNAKLEANASDWKTFFYNNLVSMYEKSNNGIVFNCMTEHVDWTYDRLYYPSLSDLTAFITKNMSRNFIVDHNYDLYEMTIYINK
ncbi:class I SAM-dependent methyltransferase [Lacinutrix salivirga]